ncbi:hypothetical protein [Streptococcus sobrinus]|uniref:hypothetical protein n=1 Tax=Streptococcus sobrinus TaxID=1310 RepID=UPI0002EE1469|nr:hypothetical protein [Streptococcus sobrinus]
MTKKEWLEYFQLVNGREARPEEVKLAFASGEFQAEDVGNAPQAQTDQNPVTPETPESAQLNQEVNVPTASEPSQNIQVKQENETVGTSESIQASQQLNPVPPVPNSPEVGVMNDSVQAPTGPEQTPSGLSQPIPTQNPNNFQAGQVNQPSLTGQIQDSQYYSHDQIVPIKKANKKWKWILISLVALLGTILLIGGGYSTWRYTSANIEGTWQQTDYKVYNEDKERWSSSKDDDVPKDFHSYLKVDKDKSVQYFAYYTATDYIYNYFDDSSRDYLRSEDYSAVTAESYLGSFDKVDQWNRQFKPSLSKSDYQEKLEEVYKNKLGYNKSDAEDQAKEEANDYAKLMGKKPKYKLTYTVDGDKMTVQRTKVSTGKVVYTAHYKRLSNDKASSVQDDLKDKKSEFKEHMDESDDSDDNY